MCEGEMRELSFIFDLHDMCVYEMHVLLALADFYSSRITKTIISTAAFTCDMLWNIVLSR